jgi:TRAP-type transport system small permease protein
MLNQIEFLLVSATRWLLISMLAAMSVIVFANVAMRYTTGDSLVWAEEVARHLMIWCTFIGAGLAFRFGGHVAIDTMQQNSPERVAQALRLVVAGVIAVFCICMAYNSLDYLAVMRFQTTPATGIPFSYVYAAMPAGLLLVLAHLAFALRRYVLSGQYDSSNEFDADAAAAL